MKVLLVNKFFRRGAGAETVFFDTLEILEADGHDVVPFAMAHEDNEASSWSPHFARRRDYVHGGSVTKGRDAIASIYSFEARRKLRGLLRAFAPDVAHLHNVYHQLTLSIVDELRSADVPTVMTLHDYKPVCPSYLLLASDGPCTRCVTGSVVNSVVHRCIKGSVVASAVGALEASLVRHRRQYEKIDRLIAPSAFARDVMVRGGFSASRVDIIPNPVSHVQPECKSPSAPTLLYVGRLAPEKGLMTLLDALGFVQTRGIVLEVYGSGPLASVVQRRVDREGLPVVFHGLVGRSEVAAALGRARALVLPSVCHENSPMALLEAAAAGVPAIASRIGGIPEIIKHGSSGLLVEPGNAHELARAIDVLAADEAVSVEFGRAAQRAVSARHGRAAYRDALLDSYQRAGRPRRVTQTVGAAR